MKRTVVEVYFREGEWKERTFYLYPGKDYWTVRAGLFQLKQDDMGDYTTTLIPLDNIVAVSIYRESY